MCDNDSATTPLSLARIAPGIAAADVDVSPAHHLGDRVAGRGAEGSADLLVVGRIATGDPAAPTAEAMAISGGRIIGLGSAADLDGLTGPATQTVAPDGVVIPGLIEPHAHVWISLLTLDWTDVSHVACPRFDDVVATLKAAAAAAPAGEYLLAKRFDPSLYPASPTSPATSSTASRSTGPSSY